MRLASGSNFAKLCSVLQNTKWPSIFKFHYPVGILPIIPKHSISLWNPRNVRCIIWKFPAEVQLLLRHPRFNIYSRVSLTNRLWNRHTERFHINYQTMPGSEIIRDLASRVTRPSPSTWYYRMLILIANNYVTVISFNSITSTKFICSCVNSKHVTLA